jgi:hypothetical protein
MTSFTNVQVNYPRLHSILDVGKVEEGQLEFLFVGVVSKAVVRVRFLIRPQSCRATLHRTRFSSFCKKKNDLASPPLSVRYFVILYGSASKSASEPPPRSKSRRKYPQFEAFPRSSLVEKSMKLLRRKSILKLPNSHLHHSVTS